MAKSLCVAPQSGRILRDRSQGHSGGKDSPSVRLESLLDRGPHCCISAPLAMPRIHGDHRDQERSLMATSHVNNSKTLFPTSSQPFPPFMPHHAIPGGSPSVPIADKSNQNARVARAESCEIEMSAANDDAPDEALDTEPQSLLAAGTARSDSMQGANLENNQNSSQVPMQHSSSISNAKLGLPELDFDDAMPFCEWIGRLERRIFKHCNPGSKCLRYGCEMLSCLFLLIVYIPCIAIDLIIIFLYRFPTKCLLCRRDGQWFMYRDGFEDLRSGSNGKLALTAIISLVITLSLILPTSTPSGHNGSSIIEGSCSNRTRCDASASCDTLSPSSYTCSCPNWLVGSGFDDDPCICLRSVLPIPDFNRNRCVTRTSHFTMPGLIGFIVGMTIFFMIAMLAVVLNMPHLLWIWFLVVAMGARGWLTPYPEPICGQSSFGARVCETEVTGASCIDGNCVPCQQGQRWEKNSGCLDGAAGRCTAQSCNNVPNSTCVESQRKNGWQYECQMSSGSIITSVSALMAGMMLMILV